MNFYRLIHWLGIAAIAAIVVFLGVEILQTARQEVPQTAISKPFKAEDAHFKATFDTELISDAHFLTTVKPDVSEPILPEMGSDAASSFSVEIPVRETDDSWWLDYSSAAGSSSGPLAVSGGSSGTTSDLSFSSPVGGSSSGDSSSSGTPSSSSASPSSAAPSSGSTSTPTSSGAIRHVGSTGGSPAQSSDLVGNSLEKKINSVYSESGSFLVETDDARFEYANGKITFYQGPLPLSRRLIATATFNNNLLFEKVEENEDYVLFQSDGVSVEINKESMCTINPDIDKTFVFQTEFVPRYLSRDNDTVLLAGIGGKVKIQTDTAGVIRIDQKKLERLSCSFRNKSTIQLLNTPMVLWTHRIYADSLQSLQTALSSGLVTHVMIKRLHRYDCAIQQYASAEPMVPKSIELCHQYGVPVILARNLWPSWRIRESRESDLYQADYYVKEIQILQNEVKELGADYTGLDTEPYGDSPLKNNIKDFRRYTIWEMNRLKTVIQSVLDTTGQIDFILPAGSNLIEHPYNVIANVGRYRISEHTYYDNEQLIRGIKYPYEIFGAFINTTKKNANQSDAPYYLASEIFEKSERWLGKEGLFLWKEGQKNDDHALTLALQMQRWNQER